MKNSTMSRQETMYNFLLAESKRIDKLLAKFRKPGEQSETGKRGYAPRMENKFTLDEAILKALGKRAKTTPEILEKIRSKGLYNSNSDTFDMRVNVRLNEMAKAGTVNKEGRGRYSKPTEAPKKKRQKKTEQEPAEVVA